MQTTRPSGVHPRTCVFAPKYVRRVAGLPSAAITYTSACASSVPVNAMSSPFGEMTVRPTGPRFDVSLRATPPVRATVQTSSSHRNVTLSPAIDGDLKNPMFVSLNGSPSRDPKSQMLPAPTGGDEWHEHVVRSDAAVSGEQARLAGIVRIDEADRGRRGQDDVTDPVADGPRRRFQTEPAVIDQLVAREDPCPVTAELDSRGADFVRPARLRVQVTEATLAGLRDT